MGRLVPPRLNARHVARRVALTLAIAVPLLLREARVLLAPADDGLRRLWAPVPGPGHVAVAFGVAALVAHVLLRRDDGERPFWSPLLLLLAGLLPVVPLLTGRAVALTFFQGPVLLMVAIVALALTLSGAQLQWRLPAPAGAVTFAAAVVVFGTVSTRLPGAAGAQGDEPHYLLMAESLWRDGDVDLANQLRERAYAPYYAGTLEPHASPASGHGQVLPVHAPGLALLAAPAWAIGGADAVRWLMVLLAAATAAMAAGAIRDATGDDRVAWAAWGALVLTPPLPLYAVSIYPEVLAALLTAVALRGGRGVPSLAAVSTTAILAAALPWAHPKFLPLAAGALLLVLLRPVAWWQRMASAALSLASWAGLLAWFHAVYGRASVSAAYGSGFADDVSLARAPWGALALLTDRQFGLLAVSPIWFLALAGVPLLWRRRPGDVLRAVILIGLGAGVGACFSMWWGGSCPPARFLVPALPALALLAAAAIERVPRTAAALGAIGTAVLVLAMDAPRALHNRGDADSGLLRHLAPALDLDGFLPSFVAATDAALAARLLTAALALSLLTTGAIGWTRGRRAGLVALLATLALAVSVRGPQPLLDPRASVAAVLQSWDPSQAWSPVRGRSVEGLAVPIDLGATSWSDIRPGDVRVSRRVDVPPGLYTFDADTEIEADPTLRALKLEIVADELLLAKTYARAGEAIEGTAVLLPVGARRLQVTASGVHGRSSVRGVFLRPLQIVPATRRDGLDWPRLAQPDRYRVGERVLTTALDRSEPNAEGFAAATGDRFVVEAPAGSLVSITTGAPGASLEWNGRTIRIPATVPAEGEVLARTVVVPVRLRAPGVVGFAPAR